MYRVNNKFAWVGLLLVFLFAFHIHPAFVAAEPPLWEIYNTLYGTSLTSNTDLWDNYGYVCSDTGDPCTVATEATDCPGGTCDRPIGDEVFEETNGYVMAGVRYAGYTQAFGFYDGLCTGANPVELFNVTTTGYLFRCSAESQNPGASCIVDGDCPDGTCDPLYDADFLVGGGTAVIGFYCDPSGSPQWYSQPGLNVDGNNDHLWTFRASDYTPSNPEYLLAWEDLNLGDADHNDLVVITGHLESSAVQCCVDDDDCPDDALFCNGDEICVDSVCSHSGNPCAPYACDEDEVTWGGDGTCIVDPPITYQFDFNDDEVWDTAWCIETDGTVDVEIWVDDYSLIDNMFGTAFYLEYGSNLKLNYAECSGDSDNPGDTCTLGMKCSDDSDNPGELCYDDGDCPNGTCQADYDCPNGTCEIIKECSEDADNPDDPCTVDGDCPNGTCEDVSYIYDSNHGGPWLPLFSFLQDEGGWVRFELHAGQFWGGGVSLPEGKVKIAKLQLERTAGGDSQLNTDDGAVIDMGARYFVPDDAIATINDCDDGVDCTVDSCNPDGSCQNVPDDNLCNDGNVCTDEVCNPATGCVYTNNTDPCDDGLYCSGADTCSGGSCSVHEGDPCDDGNTCTDDTCHEDLNICTNICNVSSTTHLDPCCSDPACSSCLLCQAAGLVNIGKFWANCGSVGVKIDICLQNLEIPVGGFQMDLCEGIDDCLICTECELTERTVIFDCVVNELANGCCRVMLFAKHPGGLINPGECDIVTVVYEIRDEEECCSTCIEIDGENVVLSDEYGYEISGLIGDLGAVCPFVCGDVYPGESTPVAGDCGDGVVDLFDILEEVSFALGLETPDNCQGNPTGPRDDVPTGTPIILPVQCMPPDLQIDILDIMVIIDMALNRQDCCSYYYGGTII